MKLYDVVSEPFPVGSGGGRRTARTEPLFGEAVGYPWRFYVRGNPCVSKIIKEK